MSNLTPNEIEVAKKHLYDKYANKAFTTTEEMNGHCWGIWQNGVIGKGMEMCLYCLIIRRRDKQNTPCKGPSKITTRNTEPCQ